MNGKLTPAVGQDDHIQGATNAPIILLEYGDYQCSYCGEAYSIIKFVQKKFDNRLQFVFRNFPLNEAHPDAFNAALVAEAAAVQGKFWEMHDILYEHQDRLDLESLAGYAKEIGMDAHQFERDIHGTALSDKVEQDFESGIRSGVNGTPSFYVNGSKFEGDWSEQGLADYLNDADSK
jgi:protein-disulfide isomerase